jgi:methylmalonyl-CoA/ethylmalonyl-CoA epimerase
MNLIGIEHIGIAVKNLDDAVIFYENILGLKCYAIEHVADQHVKTAFFKIGDVKIELLESTSRESPIFSFIEKRGEGIHHIAYKVENVNSSLVELKNKGIKLIDKEERIGAEGLAIGFLNPKSTFSVLIELCSSNNSII